MVRVFLVTLLAVLMLAGPARAHVGGPPDDGSSSGQVEPDGWDDGDDGSWDDGTADDGTWPPDAGEDPGVDPGIDPTATGQLPVTTVPPATRPPRLPRTPAITLPPLVTTATVPGETARLRTDGKAAIPRGAPKRVRAIIAAANQIVGKPYKWGGGHARLVDRGYDCSGAVGYGLIGAGLLAGPVVSGQLARWGAAGPGRWMTIYATRAHVYLEVAGLRLDTSAVADPTPRSGVRWRPVIGKRPGFHVRHVVGL